MRSILSALILMMIVSLNAEAQQLRAPVASPAQTVKQQFALSDVEVSYSRPAKKGRKIFGDLVPFGKVWRTGANQATTISFGEDVTFGDKKVPAGKYGLLSIPGQSEWTIILTKQLDVTNPNAYKQDQDVARVTAAVQGLPFELESFTIMFNTILPSSMELMIVWDATAVSVPVKADVDSKVMAQIDQAMNKDNKPYFAAAMYYLENGKDLNKAMPWFAKAAEQNPNAFWIYHQQANAYAKLGKKQEAIAAARKSMELAKQQKNDDYISLNEKLLATLK